MKKIIIAVLILAGSSTVSFAQSQKGKTQSVQSPADSKQIGVEMAAKAETDKWTKALSLTADQKTQIHEVNMYIAKTSDLIKQAGSGAHPDRMTHLMKSKDMKYKNILTTEQYTKYEKMINGTNIGSTNNLKAN